VRPDTMRSRTDSLRAGDSLSAPHAR
jgi:hypothetical protein